MSTHFGDGGVLSGKHEGKRPTKRRLDQPDELRCDRPGEDYDCDPLEPTVERLISAKYRHEARRETGQARPTALRSGGRGMAVQIDRRYGGVARAARVAGVLPSRRRTSRRARRTGRRHRMDVLSHVARPGRVRRSARLRRCVPGLRAERFVWGGHYEPASLIWRSRWVTGSAIVEMSRGARLPRRPRACGAVATDRRDRRIG